MRHLIGLVLMSIDWQLSAQTNNELLVSRAGDNITTGDFNVIIGDGAGTTIDTEKKCDRWS